MRLSVVKQIFFGPPGPYGSLVTRANSIGAVNRPFPNYLLSLFQSKSWCSSFHMKISFHLHLNER